MSQAQRIGQLIMVGANSTHLDPAAVATIQADAVGSVILMGTSSLSITQTATITTSLQRAAPPAAGLFIATDQEGGQIRRLRGPGFSDMPSALEQSTLAPNVLQAQAMTWGSQLSAAGINLDLAPDADTITDAAAATRNPPIGQYDREYGYGPEVVAAHATAVAQGMLSAGVDVTAKHFPGLGRVNANTDTASGVTDSVTTSTDVALQPFAALVKAGVPFVMMSTAIYTQLDAAEPAAFSPTIINGLLREQLGFDGVVISDDLGAAAQVAAYSPGTRALDFIQAGGDMILTVEPSTVAPMVATLLAKAATDPTLRTQIDAAALRILEAKQTRGLLH